MALDPQARVLLDQLEAVGAPPMSQRTPEEARAAMALLGAVAGAAEDPVPTVDRTVPGPAGAIPVRVYRPESDRPLPVVVYFHGGGWVVGDIATHDTTCQRLAVGVPAVVVSVDYRLAPEHPFPAAVEDCEAATQWVSANAAELGADGARLAVAGDSAGGNLAAVISRRARDAGGPPIAFQLLVYPATDLTASFPSHVENGTGYLLDTDSITWFMGNYLAGADARQPDASPLFADDLSGLPPAFVLTAEFDPLRDEGEAYAERLREAGVPATATRYDGMIHGFYGLDSIFDSATKATAETVAALRDALGSGVPLEVTPLTVTIGAEVSGVDLTDDLDDAVIDEIRAALLEWKVLFFRDQHRLDRDRHIAFGRRFGALEIHPVTPAGQEQPEVFVIPAGGAFRAPDTWHSDVTWRPEPSLGSILRAVELPPLGGDTLWADMGKAYDLLDDETKARIDGAQATHDYASAFGRNQPPDIQAKMRAQHPTVEHPVVRTHPETGRKTLYVNVAFTRSIVGMDKSEGHALLSRLYRQSTIVDVQCRFRWRPGSVAFWDNRATQHVVSNDFLPAKRVMERVTVVGDRPF